MKSQIFITDLSCIGPADLKELLASLPGDRQEKALRYKYEENRRQCTGAWILFQYALEINGIKEDDLVFSENEHGKPLAHFKNDGQSLYFNLSHSGDMAMCAISEHPVGCDAEKIREIPEKISSLVYSPSEAESLAEIKDPLIKQELFFLIWTRKESLLKMQGSGLSRVLTDFSVWPKPAILKTDLTDDPVFFYEYSDNGYRFCCCTKAMQPDFIKYNILDKSRQSLSGCSEIYF